MVREFKAGVANEDYDTEVSIHSGSFAQLIEVVRSREQDLDCNASLRSKRRNKGTRRARTGAYLDDTESDDDRSDKKRKAEKDSSGKPPKPKTYVPFIPQFLFNSLDKDAKKNMSKWRDGEQWDTHMKYAEDMLVDSKRDDSDADPQKVKGSGVVSPKHVGPVSRTIA